MRSTAAVIWLGALMLMGTAVNLRLWTIDYSITSGEAQLLRKTACRSSSYRNRFYTLVDSCRLSYLEEFRGRSHTPYSIYACLMFESLVTLFFPAFDLEILEPSGNVLLKYYPEALRQTLQKTSNSESNASARVLTLDKVLWGTDGLAQFEWNYDYVYDDDEEEHNE